ncbi:12890_t:CDS:2 [Funneliformis caledonium]|uniref:12890_t:CDS:1 n=1 Tax=Funneliformis caledonium TaxID=1117310 RepID=A0A9N9D4T0_9GLOM|nr:12890_t:CDS:2 [Funneliformis caledonium]
MMWERGNTSSPSIVEGTLTPTVSIIQSPTEASTLQPSETETETTKEYPNIAGQKSIHKEIGVYLDNGWSKKGSGCCCANGVSGGSGENKLWNQ